MNEISKYMRSVKKVQENSILAGCILAIFFHRRTWLENIYGAEDHSHSGRSQITKGFSFKHKNIVKGNL